MNNIYFNYNPILSHNAEINIITALRGVGKSYGAKVKIFNAYFKEKRTFIWVRRTDEQLKMTKATFLSDLQANDKDKYKNFYIVGNFCYYKETETKIIKHKDGTEEEIEETINIDIVGTFISLSVGGNFRGFATDNKRIKYLIFDEFIEEDEQKYLKNEIIKFSSIMISALRLADAKIIMLSNALSSANPYFKLFEVKITDKRIISYNIRIKVKYEENNKIIESYVKLRIAFQYGADNAQYKKKTINSVSGKIALLCDYAESAINDKFIFDDTTHIIEPKKMLKYDFKYNICYDKIYLGVYQTKNDITYIYKPISKGLNYIVNDIQEASKNENNILINHKHVILKILYAQYSNGFVAFSDIHTQQAFINMLNDNL